MRRGELGDPELALSGTGDEGARRLGEYVLDGEEGLEGDENCQELQDPR